MSNRLIHETSPYLLQHANNPVDWFAWDDEALQKALNENKPIFLSIGYAACHWCHVMEHESFENPETADLLNRYFVSIKVDREERPDIDQIYMEAVVAMTGQGGWPMSVFLTPEGKPFYGGTYFPPDRRHGLPAFNELLLAVAQAWSNNPQELIQTGHQLFQHIQASTNWRSAKDLQLSEQLLIDATKTLVDTYDWQYGGWGSAPRFPGAMAIEFLMAQHSRNIPDTLKPAIHALKTMQKGGLYDVAGGGFHRYSTDDAWLAPHFEKMLYDNALLALAYLHAFQITGDEDFLRTTTQTLDFILRELTHPDGGFFSSLDADSEGEEGKFYVWSLDEIQAVLPDAADFDFISRVYGISKKGNFEGKNILKKMDSDANLANSLHLELAEFYAELDRLHRLLLEARSRRVRPNTDDKVLVFWNALAIRAFTEAGRSLNRPDYLEAAQKNAQFILSAMHPDRRLLRSWREGKAHLNAYLEDYAALIIALLTLHASGAGSHWYQEAAALSEEMLAGFRDESGGFFNTRSDHGPLLVRPKDLQDNATPSGNSLAAIALLWLSELDENDALRQAAQSQFAVLQEVVVRHPTGFANWLQAMDFAIGPVKQVAIVWDNQAQAGDMLKVLGQQFLPRSVTALSPYPPFEGSPALLKDRPLQDGKATAYVCEGFVCRLPVTSAEGLEKQLSG